MCLSEVLPPQPSERKLIIPLGAIPTRYFAVLIRAGVTVFKALNSSTEYRLGNLILTLFAVDEPTLST